MRARLFGEHAKAADIRNRIRRLQKEGKTRPRDISPENWAKYAVVDDEHREARAKRRKARRATHQERVRELFREL